MKNKKLRNYGIGFLIYFIFFLGLTLILALLTTRNPIMFVLVPWWALAIPFVAYTGGFIFSIAMIMGKRGAILGVASALVIKIIIHVINLAAGVGKIQSILIPIALLIFILKFYFSESSK